MKTHTALVWPTRPNTKHPHHDLGKRQRWMSKCGRFRVEHFQETTLRAYIALYAVPESGYVWHSVSRHKKHGHRTLNAAKRACEHYARALRRHAEAQRVHPA